MFYDSKAVMCYNVHKKQFARQKLKKGWVFSGFMYLYSKGTFKEKG